MTNVFPSVEESVTMPEFRLSEDPATQPWPLWRRVEQAILDGVRRGGLAPGAQLPGEHQLAAELGAHRHTVRRALESLRGRGIVEIRRGSGTFLVEAAIPYRIGRQSRFTGNIRASGREPGLRGVRTVTAAADPDIARRLGLEEGARVVLLEMVRTADALPILIARHAMPAARFPDFGERFREIQSITRTFASYGVVDYVRQLTRLSARLPTQTEAGELAQGTATPVLDWASVNVDRDGQPINYDASVFAATRVDIVFDDHGSDEGDRG
jgi:GntR family phosphonate transport system transcriptional regulator